MRFVLECNEYQAEVLVRALDRDPAGEAGAGQGFHVRPVLS